MCFKYVLRIFHRYNKFINRNTVEQCRSFLFLFGILFTHFILGQLWLWVLSQVEWLLNWVDQNYYTFIKTIHEKCFAVAALPLEVCTIQFVPHHTILNTEYLLATISKRSQQKCQAQKQLHRSKKIQYNWVSEWVSR